MKQHERLREIISIISARRHVTVEELARELGVCPRTIRRDICELSVGYPIYTKQGVHGDIFIMDSYRPYNNTLTPIELEMLQELYRGATKKNDKTLLQIIHKYGPTNVES